MTPCLHPLTAGSVTGLRWSHGGPPKENTFLMLKQLRTSDASALWLVWDDHHEGPVTLRSLRDNCPCAGCSGESVLLHHARPLLQDYQAPGRYELRSATPVGNYAIRLSWGDHHDHGIYTWDHLRSLCECDACLRARGEPGG